MPVASIFMPEMTTPSSSSRITRQAGFGRFFFWKKSGSRDGLRRDDRMRGEDVVVAHELVIVADIVGIFAEQFRLQVHAGDEARDIIRRAAEQAETWFRQHPVRVGALRELLLGLAFM